MLFGGTGHAYAINDFTCLAVLDVPVQECQALVDLYTSTNGPGWIRKENWLVTPTVDDWIGVTVSGGHVTGLSLEENLLSGSLPASLGDLSELIVLSLRNNQLNGSPRAPRAPNRPAAR